MLDRGHVVRLRASAFGPANHVPASQQSERQRHKCQHTGQAQRANEDVDDGEFRCFGTNDFDDKRVLLPRHTATITRAL